MVEEKVKKGILRSEYLRRCKYIDQTLKNQRYWSPYVNFCEKGKYLEYVKDSDIAKHLLSDTIEIIIQNVSIKALKDDLLSDIWEEPSPAIKKENKTATSTTTEESLGLVNLFEMRKKRMAEMSHNYTFAPTWDNLRGESLFKVKHLTVMDKQVKNHLTLLV